jgi:hypothetical protein
MNTPNLHALLSAITLPHLKAYLAHRGWSESIADGRLYFTMASAEGESQSVFVPADRAHPRFRSLLQNLMFSLSVIEKREPVDVAHEVSKFEIPNIVASTVTEHQLHDIASQVRGLAQECIESEQAKGKLLELTRFLLGYQVLSIAVTPQLADELWAVARADKSYFPSATSAWLATHAKTLPTRPHS